MPSVSVLIPAYNSAKYIKRSIDSVLNQTVLPSEIIVIDDGSTDETAAIANSYGGIVRVISKGRNCGQSAARNFGIQNAIGEWIAFLDSDDEWEPKKHQMALALVQLHKTDWCMVARREIHNNHDKSNSDSLTGDMICENYFSLVLQGKGCAPSSTMVRKSVFARVGGFNEVLTTGEDLEMWWRIANVIPKISYYSQPLVKYYVDVPGSMTNSSRNESKLIAFWDAVTQISSPIDDPINSELFIKVRNIFASRAIRYYLRAGHYKVIEQLKGKTMISCYPLTKLLVMLPRSFSKSILMLLDHSRIGYFRYHIKRYKKLLWNS
jgi:glycosyltransferase involved in cell wall biosynthesis